MALRLRVKSVDGLRERCDRFVKVTFRGKSYNEHNKIWFIHFISCNKDYFDELAINLWSDTFEVLKPVNIKFWWLMRLNQINIKLIYLMQCFSKTSSKSILRISYTKNSFRKLIFFKIRKNFQ